MNEPIMEGHGYYNRHSQLQARSAAEADAVLERALAAVSIPPGPVTLADFGCSQGHNSLRPLGLALDLLVERIGWNRDIMVVHTDLPRNDFNSLFVALETAPDSYRRGREQVFASAIGRSFYERLLPAGCVTFGWSSFALHWLSASALTLRAHIWPVFAAADEAEALAAVAARDWRNFLSNRAAELVPGGQLVLVIGAVDGLGASGLEPMMDLANEILKALVVEGRLEAGVYDAMSIPSLPRSRQAFTAPFEQGELPELSLEELIMADTPNAALLAWEENHDAAALAVAISGFFVAAFGPSLFGDDRGLRDLFACRFSAAIAFAPGGLARPLHTATLRIARR